MTGYFPASKYKEQMKRVIVFDNQGLKLFFLQPVCFTAHSFDPVPVDCPGKVF